MTDKTMDALHQLAAPTAPKPLPYDFEHLAEMLSDSLMQSAEELMTGAHRIANDMRTLAADIRGQSAQQSEGLADITARLKASGERVLDAHRHFNGG